ncbi:MAG: TlpA family protein disulfide reductase [candidate division NC10 bacterium]|nr:TlpA family protein disulfide reductase [candidate division NC10 bacterium]
MIPAHLVLLLFALALELATAAPAWSAEDRPFEVLGFQRPSQRVEAPDVALTDLDGKSVSLKSFRGKLLLVNFWATWCIPCLYEMPEFEQLYQAYKDKGFVVLAVSVDQGDPEVVRRYVVERKLTYPVFHDPQGHLVLAFRLPGFPATYLLGPDGALLGVLAGPRAWGGPEARALIGELLRARPEKKTMVPLQGLGLPVATGDGYGR